MIIFNTVFLNDGQGYNPETGVFKTQHFGVYRFTVNLCSARNGFIATGLKGQTERGAFRLGTFYAPPNNYPSCYSSSIIARLRSNVDITLQYRRGNFFVGSEYSPSFSGYLLYALSEKPGKHL